ncbi:AAA family ATPase [Desulfolutivibrio sp.]|uniref:AAA family ATPase n=1 Tax=Desulfolutivibrio sp. TaxID=2773296 RepID=UPI002F968353
MLADALAEFRRVLQRAGLVSEEIIADGNLHRCGTVGKERGKDGAYILHPDPPVSGWYQNYRTGEEGKWTFKRAERLTPEDSARIKARAETSKMARQENLAKQHAEAQEKASRIFAEAQQVPSDHPYLVRKNIEAVGEVRCAKDGRLIVPVFNVEEKLQSLQFIDQSGSKRFLSGGKVSGGYFQIKGGDESIYIVEGYATGATIHAVTGATTFIAFTAGNIMAVAESVREKYRDKKIIIAADDDNATAGNPGLTKGKAAASKIGADLAVPKFRDHDGKSDFNDLAQAEGLEAVKSSLAAARLVASVESDAAHGCQKVCLEEWRSTKKFSGTPPVRKYLVDGVFPLGQVSLLAAAGGVGKSFSLLGLAHDVARGVAAKSQKPRHFGGMLCQEGAAIYLSGEDDDIELHNRIATLGGPCERLIAIPIPSVGGSKLFFKMDAGTKNPIATPEWSEIVCQMKIINDVKIIIIDPLQVFCALDLNTPEYAQFVCSTMSALAAETGASVIISHHFRKTKEVKDAKDAREAIRGTAGLVDGVRSVYTLWEGIDIEKKCQNKTIISNMKQSVGCCGFVCGAVVKSNGLANKHVSTFMRGFNGILHDVTKEVSASTESTEENENTLIDMIAKAEQQGKPYTKTGESGLFSRRHELGSVLSGIAKHRLEKMCEKLLDEKMIVTALAKGSRSTKWLDIPDGPFAKGDGTFLPGHVRSKN